MSVFKADKITAIHSLVVGGAQEDALSAGDVAVQGVLHASGGVNAGSGTYWYVDAADGSVSFSGRSPGKAVATVQEAIDRASAGDKIIIAPGTYDEEVTLSTSNLTLIGQGGRGAIAIAPSDTNVTAFTIDGTTGTQVTDVTLVNLGLEGGGTGSALHVKGDARRVRAYSCKIEGGASALLLESTAEGALSDNRFENCEFAWADTNAIRFAVSGGGDPVTQTYFRNCLLHNYVTRGIFVDTVHTADLWVEDCFFGNQEDATEPTDYVIANVASTTGFFSGNRFATATNAAAKLTIAAGVIWVANATEAGWSTARPA